MVLPVLCLTLLAGVGLADGGQQQEAAPPASQVSPSETAEGTESPATPATPEAATPDASQASPSDAPEAQEAPARPQAAKRSGRATDATPDKEKGATPPTPPPEPACDPTKGDACLVAETQGREKGHFWGRGFADLRMGDLQIQTDAIDVFDIEQGGVVTQQLVANGNVVLLRKEERIVGDSLTMDLSTGRGTMENVVGYLEPGVYFTARQVERVNPKVFKIRGGRFTSCCQPNPRWSFAASRATLKVGDHITATNVHFDFATPPGVKVPLLYLPYFMYPTKEDRRATGFLLPSVNYDTVRGMDVRLGFFWAMGRSFDQTFSYEYRPSMSNRLSHELRYVLSGPSRGTFSTVLFPPGPKTPTTATDIVQANAKWDYSLDWNAVQLLPGKFQGKVFAKMTSTQDIGLSVQDWSNTTRTFNFSIMRSFGSSRFQLLTKSNEVTVGQRVNTNTSLPQIRLSQAPRALGQTGVLFEYTALAERLGRRNVNTNKDVRSDWSRYDLSPAVSRPIVWSFLSLTPRLQTRYSHYTKTFPVNAQGQVLTGQGITGSPLTYEYIEGSFDIQGPQFSRVFTNPTSVYSDKFKHVIGPEAVYLYRKSSGGDERIPFSDTASRELRTHEVQYGIANHFYGRRKVAGGKNMPFELLSWRIYRKHYIDRPVLASNANLRDPAFLSNLVSPDGLKYRNSPWRSDLSLRPAPRWQLTWQHEYEPALKKTTSFNLRASVAGALGTLGLSWARTAPFPLDEDTTFPETYTISSNGELTPLGERLRLGGSLSYDKVNKLFRDRTAYVRISVQCIGLLISMTERQYYLGAKPVRNFGFALDLANLTTIGMDPSRSGGAVGGGARMR